MAEKHHSVKERIEKSKAICALYSAGNLTLESCCENQGITDRTFHAWKSEISEVSLVFKEASHKADLATRDRLVYKSLTSMEKLIEGYEVTETHQEGDIQYDQDGNEIGIKTKRIKKVKKHVAPHPTMIIFALKSLTARFKEAVPVSPVNQEQVFMIGDREVRF